MSISELDPPQKGRSITLTVVRPEIRKPLTFRPASAQETAGATHSSAYTMRIPSQPTTFRFAKQSSASGIKFLIFSVLFIAAAAFLLVEMANTPLLRTPIITVSLVCIAIGAALAHLAVRNLFGRLRVDAQGIRLSPGYLGYFIPWSELRGWNMDGFAFRFRSQKSKHDLTVDCDHLTADDRQMLHEVLLSCATEKEFARAEKKAEWKKAK
ncbi:MAG: hypothetical protein K8U03_17860 [Planctomycetia bacterium]|nr:hypothetical protein [Planctomycetia bacterium]